MNPFGRKAMAKDSSTPAASSAPDSDEPSQCAGSGALSKGDWLAASSLVTLVALALYCIGRPIFTDDFWWHVALGGYYSAEGPLLAFDPLLFASEGPPDPASWLFDLVLFGVGQIGGFTLLRCFHVGLVVATLAVAARMLRGVNGLAIGALGLAIFTMLSVYRVAQLRPELATILLTLLVAGVVLSVPARLSWKRCGSVALLCAVWANLHAGFVLGPLVLGTGCAAILISLPLLPASVRPEQSLRARDLALASGLGFVATLANPQGFDAYLAYFESGTHGAELSLVRDEWQAGTLLAFPSVNLPPTPLVWGLLHLVFLGAAASSASSLRAWRRGEMPAWADPALLGLSAIALIFTLLAVRFSWLGIFPLVFTLRWMASLSVMSRRSLVVGLASLSLVPGFLLLGDWPFLSRGVPRTPNGYAEPFAARKYYADAAWFLRDLEMHGRMFTAYSQAGFYGLWLAPHMKFFVNGSLNVPRATVDDYFRIQTGHGLASRADLVALLDRYEVDYFLGTGLPTPSLVGRPWRYTTSHLEGAPGWLLAYRSINTALYVRNSEANREQVQRIARYYEERGIDFDLSRGLDVAGMLEAAQGWSIQQGLVPRDFQKILTAARDPKGREGLAALNRLAGLYATLGLYEDAIMIDRELTRRQPSPSEARRRLVWCLLRRDLLGDALEASRRLRHGALEGQLAGAVRTIAGEDDPEIRARMTSFVPFLSRAEGARLASGRLPVSTRDFPAAWGRSITRDRTGAVQAARRGTASANATKAKSCGQNDLWCGIQPSAIIRR